MGVVCVCRGGSRNLKGGKLALLGKSGGMPPANFENKERWRALLMHSETLHADLMAALVCSLVLFVNFLFVLLTVIYKDRIVNINP